MIAMNVTMQMVLMVIANDTAAIDATTVELLVLLLIFQVRWEIDVGAFG